MAVGRQIRRAADLSPAAARHEVPDTQLGMTIQQIDRPPLVLKELHVPCACGRPLVGQEWVICGNDLLDSVGGTVFVRGVCLTCGVQTAIFAPPAQAQPEESTLQNDILRLVKQVMTLRAVEAGTVEDADDRDRQEVA
jgi:hypothetical protein